ncbi:GNAT family N-acetyltransferase [Flavobacterium sp. NST-5]|uniref:GNAT family N-acetyltransferase n=1 Tax=Flavobacterium ichthyis TaxID=2698827 RepID=A0ABW9ZAA4_9FLAO|nr:GNAT family N-acetyltransferase [Flavobacterium ichthyis]NBL65826.1 GNAT family N-acetyltransferase [Flavobacterium ichthyis]
MLEIRPFNQLDVSYLLELLRLNTPEFFSEKEKGDYVQYLNNEVEYYFVVTKKDQVVGCGGFNFWDEGKTVRISWDILHPDFQRQGIGKLLLQHRLKEIAKFDKVEKVVVRTSQLVYRYYEKQGFVLQNIIKDYWDLGFDLYEMELQF